MAGQSLAEYCSEIEALSKLLQHQEVVQEDAPSSSEISKPTPASVGPKDLLPVKVASPKARDRNDIWTAEEAECSAVDDDIEDGRTVAEFEFKYKQAVTTSDNFLGMSSKDPSSSCCEDLVVVVQLPGIASAAELELDVTDVRLRLSSPKYKLSVHLPHKVDSEHGKAKWDSKKQALSITLPIRHGEL